ncbi:hypothetical protein ACNF5K_05010 [Fannyhessea vaginae]|uniref:hypothetical protein n=1 Tax=Fannyhessea vaginae TaxID=82135 RepID=UPI003A7FDB6A
MNCRGHETRQRIVKDYEVQPEAHIKLLANQQKHSDAGATIEDEYYVFSAKHKTDGKKEVIHCGMGAARDFLALINHKGLPLFNPLIGNTHMNIRPECDNKEILNSQNEQWNKTAKQLYNAIMWLIILWDAKPGTPLFDFKDHVCKYKNSEPFDNRIKRVNTTIKNGGKGKTLTEMINGYRTDNDIRDEICNFNILKNKIRNMKDRQGNTIESYF